MLSRRCASLFTAMRRVVLHYCRIGPTGYHIKIVSAFPRPALLPSDASTPKIEWAESDRNRALQQDGLVGWETIFYSYASDGLTD